MLIDTNIFLEWLLDQQRADECVALLERVRVGEMQAFVTDFALHSIAIILERGGKRDELPSLMRSLASFEGMSVLCASLEEYPAIAQQAMDTGLDFDDAYHAYFARRRDMPLISFDRHFDGIVQRKTPRDVVG